MLDRHPASQRAGFDIVELAQQVIEDVVMLDGKMPPEAVPEVIEIRSGEKPDSDDAILVQSSLHAAKTQQRAVGGIRFAAVIDTGRRVARKPRRARRRIRYIDLAAAARGGALASAAPDC